jgi:hypothetical protein
MFYNNQIESILLSFYHIDKYPAFGRYGGVFGRDVNALGMYASLILLFSLILRKFQKINLIFTTIIIFISLIAIILSGMRTGLLVFFGLLIIMNFKLRIINYRYLFILSVLLFVVLTLIYNSYENSKVLIDYFMNRFSIEHLINGFNSSEDGGNLRHAISYFYNVIGTREINWYNLILGMDASLGYVDNFYIFAFLKHGILLISVLLLVSVYLFKLMCISKNYIGIYFLIASIIISIKGIFIMNNFYIFIVFFIIYFWRQHENTYRS